MASRSLLLLTLLALATPTAGRSEDVCSPTSRRLCLHDGRFAAQVSWRDAAGNAGTARAVALGEKAGYFTFFGPENVEVLVKVVDGTAVNGRFWVFAGSLTRTEVTLRVDDLLTKQRRSYRQPLGQQASLADTRAFPSEASSVSSPVLDTPLWVGPRSSPGPRDHSPPEDGPDAAACEAGPQALCLVGGRFRATVRWRRQEGEAYGGAGAQTLTDDAGLFTFFSPGNPELIVKMVDGRSVNAGFWVFAAALSDVEYELEVLDTGSGRVRLYSNPRGRVAAFSDTAAFFESAQAPLAPVIAEPEEDGALISPFDVHMETGPFQDPDLEDEHYCSDFELWHTPDDEALVERVWSAGCVRGGEKVHIHLGDGTFEGSRREVRFLQVDAPHTLRVRYRDSTGVWGPWAERHFVTEIVVNVSPLRLAAVAPSPAPRWVDSEGDAVVLRADGVRQPATLLLESIDGEVLWRFRELDGTANASTSGTVLSAPAALKLRLLASDISVLELPESRIELTDASGGKHVVYLPASSVRRWKEKTFWVSSNGSTFRKNLNEEEVGVADLARHTARPFAARQPGFAVELVASGLRMPVTIAFVPSPSGRPQDPLFYVSELYGIIQVVRHDGGMSPYVTGLLNFNPTGNFPGTGEIGLTGLLVEPVTGDLLASVVYRREASGGDSPAPFFGRVIRLESDDGGLTAAGAPSVVFDTFPDELLASHMISNLTLGPDGKLYVHVGDGFEPAKASDLDHYLGKILRMELDGTPPIDNPFYDADDGISPADYVYAYGFRNPFGGAWRARDGFLYEVENGPVIDRMAKVIPGRGYGWDGDSDGVGSNEEMLTGALYNWGPPPHAPVSIVFVEPELFDGSGFSAERMGRAYVSEFGQAYIPGPIDTGKRIVELTLSDAGRLLGKPRTLVEYEGHGRASVAGLAAGPDGLYFTDFFADTTRQRNPIARGARVWRLRWLAPDTP